MRITYDPEGDVLYIGLRNAPQRDSIDIEDGVTVDLDEYGRIVGLEILDARERFGGDPLDSITVERLLGEQEPAPSR